ncbi:MAG: nucleotidyltransferase substrate binding protein [Candidatus Symbiobacter sp.]|nr:nucleotidyltransferase substrate binding protein [Candidatus Symbiobacter sp.]
MAHSLTTDLLEKATATLIKGHAIYCDRLTKNTDEPELELYRDSVVKRFEYTFETAQKLIKKQLSHRQGNQGYKNRKHLYNVAMRLNLIKSDLDWIKFRDLRERLLQDYEFEFADQAIAEVPAFLNALEDTMQRLRRMEQKSL